MREDMGRSVRLGVGSLRLIRTIWVRGDLGLSVFPRLGARGHRLIRDVSCVETKAHRKGWARGNLEADPYPRKQARFETARRPATQPPKVFLPALAIGLLPSRPR